MSDQLKVNQFVGLAKSKNKKITDSLQSKKQVLTNKNPERDLNKSVEMELSYPSGDLSSSSQNFLRPLKEFFGTIKCQDASKSHYESSIAQKENLLPNCPIMSQGTRRPIQDLFSEFNIPGPASLKLESQQHSTHSGLSRPAGQVEVLDKKPILTPVREEAESNQSSGQNKRPDSVKLRQAELSLYEAENSAFSPVETGENIFQQLKDFKQAEIAKKKKIFKYETFSMQEELKVLRKKAEEERNDLIVWQRRRNEMNLFVREVKNRVKFWSLQENQPELIEEFIKNSKSFPCSIDFQESPYKLHERWKKTLTESKNGLNIDYFCHNSSVALDPILGQLVLGVCFDSSGQSHVNLELFDKFSNPSVALIWESCQSYLCNSVSSKSKEEILENISSAWVTFTVFASRFEILDRSFNNFSVRVEDRCIYLEESLTSTATEYHLTFYGLFAGVDIFDDFCARLHNKSNCN